MKHSARMAPTAGWAPVRRAWPLAALIALASCGGGGGGGTVTPIGPVLPLKVTFEDAPILGALVQDSSTPTAQTATAVLDSLGLETGEYAFANVPTLPIRLLSQNLLNTDHTVKISKVNGKWVSYLDANSNGSYDVGEQTATLTYQDLDGSHTYTQGTDIAYTGQLAINYVTTGATVINANPVAALIPAAWDGVKPVAGLSATLLTAAATTGLSTSASSAMLNQVSSLLIAVSEALVANGLPPAQLVSVVSSVATTSGVDLTATASPQFVQAVTAAVPAALAVSATNVTTNIQAVAATTNATVAAGGGNYEALVQIAQTSSQALATTTSTAAVATLVSDLSAQVTSTAAALQTAQTVPTVDPDAPLNARVAALRLIPNYEIDAITQGLTTAANAWTVFGRTTGFALTRQTGGDVQVAATGLPFSGLMGTAPVTANYESSSATWRYSPTSNLMMRIDLNFGFTDPTTNKVLNGAVMLVCQRASGTSCAGGYDWIYLLASQAQVCTMVATLPAAMKTTVLGKINAVNVQQTTCP